MYNGNRTEWSPIRSVIIRVINKNRTTAKRESDLLPINQNYDKIRGTNKASIVMNAEKASSLLNKVHCSSARKMTRTVQLQA